MKSFLLRRDTKKPIIKWSLIPQNCFFEGVLPSGYSLAINPSDPYIILDVDRHGKIDGFNNLPKHLLEELNNTLNYPTKNNGVHYWLSYSGDKKLMNKASGLGIDLRTNKGYVVWYLDKDIRSYIHLVKQTSPELNEWLEELFS